MLRGDVSKGEPESVGSITKFHKIPERFIRKCIKKIPSPQKKRRQKWNGQLWRTGYF